MSLSQEKQQVLYINIDISIKETKLERKNNVFTKTFVVCGSYDDASGKYVWGKCDDGRGDVQRNIVLR